LQPAFPSLLTIPSHSADVSRCGLTVCSLACSVVSSYTCSQVHGVVLHCLPVSLSEIVTDAKSRAVFGFSYFIFCKVVTGLKFLLYLCWVLLHFHFCLSLLLFRRAFVLLVTEKFVFV